MTSPDGKRKSLSTPEPEEPTTQPQSNYVTPRGKKQKPSVIQGKGQPPSSADIRTPSIQRSGTSRAYSSRLSTTEHILTERHAEAHDHYERRLDKDDDSILSLTEPLDRKLKGIAEEIIEKAALFMESYLRTVSVNSGESADGMSDAIKPRPDSPMQLSNTPTDPSISTQRAGNTSDNSVLLKEKLDEANKWISWKSSSKEKNMYGPIGAFIKYVALVVKEKLTSLADPSSGNGRGCRLVLPSTKSDYNPPDADDTMRIDMGLVGANINSPVEANNGRVLYYKVIAVLEAKRKGDDDGFRDAFEQLDIYTRQMYQQQHNLRFAWGITVSGTQVRVCHFGPNRAKSFPLMDISKSEGRRAFIKVLVHWSLCEESQLGRDPTMEYLRDLKCWQIACPDEAGSMGEGADVKYYYFTTVSCQADRLFGRHTRCFLATDIRPTAVISDNNPLRPKFVIKDSWAFSKRNASEDTRDEVRSLEKVKACLLAKAAEQDIIIPKIEVGGRVSFLRNGGWVEDNTDTLYGRGKLVTDKADTVHGPDELAEDNADDANKPGEVRSNDDLYFRTHRRIVMEPIGEPLRSTTSVAEFVTVVCDVMRCHNAFVNDCGILHRDISPNNILVFRGADGIARGMLIDLDCAIDIDQEKREKREGREKRKEMTGTLPYMSINNLSGSLVEHTSLDDWESMLCVICWFATLGTISGKRRGDGELARCPIGKWRQGSTDEMIAAKQSTFDSCNSFQNLIVRHFKLEGVAGSTGDKSDKIGGTVGKPDENELLKRLAISIHKCLFQNRRLSPDCHGTFEKPKHVELEHGDLSFEELESDEFDGLSNESLPMVNPFKERAEKCETISKQLLEIVYKYWGKAMALQKGALEAKSNATISTVPQ
ncbi:hypothetical protein H4S04_007625 [Coemansia sp. S16]|nr:hypothetical protein H4S04_007625 [Coemansia sp. S16]